jgi:lipoate-protein ligase A
MVSGETLSGKWRLLDLSYVSVFENLALEEALALSNSSKPLPTVRTWINPQAAVLGRFQDISAEVNIDLCRQNSIEIARRFTGGGAVFQDKGNLNFTIVTPRRAGMTPTRLNQINCAIILDLIDQLGADGRFVPPNSIEISGRKVSGAAAALGRDFALWHASILVSTDTHLLNQVLLPSRPARATKFIRSRWQPVITLNSALGKHVELEDVKRELVRSFEKTYGVGLDVGGLSAGEEQLVESLYVRKYCSREWTLHGICS